MTEGPYDHEQNFAPLQASLGYEFADGRLLERALTHRSYANESEVTENNQRLEFLGDSVLGLVIAERMFALFPHAPEGSLSSWLASLVNEGALTEVANALELGRFLRLGRGEILSGGREKPSLLADAYEAVLAAVYLDGGLEAVRDVILRLQADAIDGCEPSAPPEDFKSRLQRLVQAEGAFRPKYDIISERGPAHERIFIAAALVDDEVFGEGEGRSKKEAEQQAAHAALKRWEDRG